MVVSSAKSYIALFILLQKMVSIMSRELLREQFVSKTYEYWCAWTSVMFSLMNNNLFEEPNTLLLGCKQITQKELYKACIFIQLNESTLREFTWELTQKSYIALTTYDCHGNDRQ